MRLDPSKKLCRERLLLAMFDDETLLSEELIAESIVAGEETSGKNGRGEKDKTLDLSFRKLVRMENLCGHGSIITLRLNNNALSVVEGLEFLVHLKHLDLSFNLIKKIQGLDGLSRLECVSFFVGKRFDRTFISMEVN